MKNLSIRWKILGGVVAINLIGAIAVVVYLHESYSGGLDVSAQRAVDLGVAAHTEFTDFAADELGPVTSVKGAKGYAEALKGLNGSDYAVLLDKTAIDEAAYKEQREAAGLPDNWAEGDTFVVAASTDEQLTDKLTFNASPDSIPEMGKVVGIENGACSKTCHGSVAGSGDYWSVRWSEDSVSRAHSVFPVTEGGKTVGAVYVIGDISDQADAAKNSMIQTLAVIGLTLLVATLVIGGMLDSLVFKRLSVMISSMEDISVRLAGGDFDAHYEPSGSTDEIGTFEDFFAKFIDTMAGTIKAILGGK